jgi:hypothetical protein
MECSLSIAEVNSLQRIEQDGIENVLPKHRAVAEDLLSDVAEALAKGESITIRKTVVDAPVLNINTRINFKLS